MPKKPAPKHVVPLSDKATDREPIRAIELPEPTLAGLLRKHDDPSDVDETIRLIADRSGSSHEHAKAWLHFLKAWVECWRESVSQEFQRLADSADGADSPDGIPRDPVDLRLSDGRTLRLVWHGDRLEFPFSGVGFVADSYVLADDICKRFRWRRVSPPRPASEWDDPAEAAACLDKLAEWATGRLAKLEGPPEWLTPDQLQIWTLLKESKRRMRMPEIEAELTRRDGAAPSQGMLKHSLSEMTRHRILTNPRRAGGYGLPGWPEQS